MPFGNQTGDIYIFQDNVLFWSEFFSKVRPLLMQGPFQSNFNFFAIIGE